jgi:hypothetical protein
MLIDIFLYLGLAFYFETVMPSQYGSPKHPLFFLSPFQQVWRFLRDKCLHDNSIEGNDHHAKKKSKNTMKPLPFQKLNNESSSSSSSGARTGGLGFIHSSSSSETEQEEVSSQLGNPYVTISNLVKEYSSNVNSTASFSFLFYIPTLFYDWLVVRSCGWYPAVTVTGGGEVTSSNKRRAVDGLNMKLWPGQVTCLLGHNGKNIYVGYMCDLVTGALIH